ncbi:response regulator [Aquabacterium sp. OR-4]|uniref:response regulator n=1 Tax=Aquabacterium sp. OR-4 TaxID=2978127 RepID=UPI0021B3DB19|nr:response regulator [Aquabacterium sp. OR-4]MDT7834625.1 response regulator [Aquabacterium sp. OR-4]
MWPTHGAQALVLIVDDNPENLTVIGELLHPEFSVRAANGGRRAIDLAQLHPQPDLILLDVMMPDIDGFEVLRQLRAMPATAAIPVLFLTALDDADSEAHALRLGAGDFITKPIRAPSLLARVRTHVALKQARKRLDTGPLHAPSAAGWQHSGLGLLQQLARSCHPDGQRHLEQVAGVVAVLGEELRRSGVYPEAHAPGWLQALVQAAPLHDIGNAAVPERILAKPEALNAGEWNAVRAHARLGADALVQLTVQDGPQPTLVRCAREIARSHHERWDGRGYPDCLAGLAIALTARVTSVADAFTAMLAPRPHRPALSLAQAREAIRDGRGQQFDPAVVDAFEARFDALAALMAAPATAVLDEPGLAAGLAA